MELLRYERALVRLEAPPRPRPPDPKGGRIHMYISLSPSLCLPLYTYIYIYIYTCIYVYIHIIDVCIYIFRSAFGVCSQLTRLHVLLMAHQVSDARSRVQLSVGFHSLGVAWRGATPCCARWQNTTTRELAASVPRATTYTESFACSNVAVTCRALHACLSPFKRGGERERVK